MSNEQQNTREAAINRICELEANADDELFGTPEPIRNAFRAGVEQGFDAGAASVDRVRPDQIETVRRLHGELLKRDYISEHEDLALTAVLAAMEKQK